MTLIYFLSSNNCFIAVFNMDTVQFATMLSATHNHKIPLWLFVVLFPELVLTLTHTFISDIQIKEEPDSGEWQLSTDSTLNTSDLSHLRVRLVDDDDQLGQEGKRLRRVACTCPNCKESGGRLVISALCESFGCRGCLCRGNRACREPNCRCICFSEDPARGKRSSTSATSQAVGKYTERRRTCEHTCAGIQGSDLLFAAGCSVGRGSHAATSCRDTGEHTQVPFFLDPLVFAHQENISVMFLFLLFKMWVTKEITAFSLHPELICKMSG